jgi:hypothetical protein
MELSPIQDAIKALLRTEFATLLAAPTSLRPLSTGTPASLPARSNNWCHGRAAVLALVLAKTSPQAPDLMVEEATFAWHEVLGVTATADATAVRRPMTRRH